MGWIPETATLTPPPRRDAGLERHPENERAFQERLMEVYAGFLEHTDTQAGRLLDELESMGIRDNTLFIYILSDNGASAEGMQGTVAELLAQNGIPSTVAEQMAAVQKLGGLSAIGGPKTDNMYYSAWAWAGDTPFRYMKLIASDFGGTRTPMAISWPAHQGRQDAAAAVPPRQRRRADDLRGSARPRSWTASGRTRSTARASPIPSTRRPLRGARRR